MSQAGIAETRATSRGAALAPPGGPAFAVQVASGTAFDVREFAAHERMSALFSIKVIAVAPDADLDFEAIIGQPARLDVRAGSARPRAWAGLCKEVHQIAAEESGLSTYEIELVPTLWLATQRRNHRIFQGMSDVDIAVRLLGEWGVEPALNLSGVYKARKFRVQYGETDYAFICRLLEEAGVSFYFSDESGLVLSDAPHTNAAREPRIPFRDHPSDSEREHVTAVRVGRRVRPGRFIVRDHDYRRPASFELRGTASAPGGVEERLEQFHYAPGAFLVEGGNGDPTPHADDRGRYRADPAEGDAMARRRLDVHRSEALTCSFETNALDLAPGVVLGMQWHPQRELCDDRDLLVIASTMRGTTGKRISHTCEARSTDFAFRPALVTAKPEVRGVESATVVGPAGEEIHTDEFGRVRVQFHWDREGQWNEQSSCWMHVSQPWGGAMYGGVNLPRIGQEVLVDFLGGDPDRPIITGRVYTNLQRVPYKLPENKTQSGWRSCSTEGTGGFNEIMFEDAAGRELVRMQAERDLQKVVKNDERRTIGQDRMTRIGRDDRMMVVNSRTTQIGADDATLAGESVSAAVSPRPGAGGSPTAFRMTHEKIVLDTGAGATITLEGNKITLDAEVIDIVGRDFVELLGKKKGLGLRAPAGQANIFTGEKFSVDTDAVSINAKQKASLSSAGVLEIDGSPVQINGPGLPSARKDDPVGGVILKGASKVFVGDGGVTTGMGDDVDALVKKSLTLTKNIKDLLAKGWKIRYGEAGKGSYCNRDSTPPEIVIDSNEKGDPKLVTQTLAHESGHAEYTPDPQVSPDGLTKDEYVNAATNRRLKDEGEATMTNAQVEQEIWDNGGPDIGIAGSQSDKYQEIYKKYPNAADRDKARQEVADIFADGEHPSTDPSKTYRDYYSQGYKESWDATHK